MSLMDSERDYRARMELDEVPDLETFATQLQHRIAKAEKHVELFYPIEDSLYAWVKRYSKPQVQRQQVDDQQAELRRLRAELKRVTEERDILKKAAAYFAKESG